MLWKNLVCIIANSSLYLLREVTNKLPAALSGWWHHQQRWHRRQINLRPQVWGRELRCSAHGPRNSVDGQPRTRHQPLAVLHNPEESRTPRLQTCGLWKGSGRNGCGGTDGRAGHKGRYTLKETCHHGLRAALVFMSKWTFTDWFRFLLIAGLLLNHKILDLVTWDQDILLPYNAATRGGKI